MSQPPVIPDISQLLHLSQYDYTPEERASILAELRTLRDAYYARAQRIGCHAFIEFAGLMGEFLIAAERAEREGKPWVGASGNHGQSLFFEPHQQRYVAEKVECIFGMRMQ